jgi:hypothetical protein
VLTKKLQEFYFETSSKYNPFKNSSNLHCMAIMNCARFVGGSSEIKSFNWFCLTNLRATGQINIEQAEVFKWLSARDAL